MKLKTNTFGDFFRRYATIITVAVASVFIILSLSINRQNTSLSKEVVRLQKTLKNRQKKLEKIARATLLESDTIWLKIKELPSDMVIYRYFRDTLGSWANQFPIDSKAEQIKTITGREQYLNIGNSWYVVKKYSSDNQKIITGLLIKNAQGQFSDKLKISKGFDIEPLTSGEEAVVYGLGASALFSLVEDVSVKKVNNVTPLAWMAVLFTFLALLFNLLTHRRLRGFLIFALGITLLRVGCYFLGSLGEMDGRLFSPKIYADNLLFSSLGQLLLNNLYVTLLVGALFIIRGNMPRFKVVAFCLAPFVAGYIYFTLNSLVINSNLVLELYRITELLSIFSLLCYLSYGLLFMALLLCLQIHSSKGILIYAFTIALYTLATVAYLSAEKEKQWSTLTANKLAIERDLSLELELRRIEARLSLDAITAVMMAQPKDNTALLQERFGELYFQNIREKYIVKLTVCRPNESVRLRQRVVDCNFYYEALLEQYGGVPIADLSSFYYLNNYNSRFGYLGIFKYYTKAGPANLYIEISSRFTDEPNGYPAEVLGYRPSEKLSLPNNYSYAKYASGRLLLYDGKYDYPTYDTDFKSVAPFKIERSSGYVHFINDTSPGEKIVISRPGRSVFPYIVSLSYLMLFYSAIFFAFIRVFRHRKTVRGRAVRKSLKKQITSLTTLVLTISLIAAGAGSVYYSINYYTSTNRNLMEEKIQTVQKNLAGFCTYVLSYNQLNTNDINEAMDRLASDMRADINLYDPEGYLLRSTKPELFTRHIISPRMEASAYYQIVVKGKSRIFNKEKLGKTKFYSLYSPIYNIGGRLIAIVNIPYFANTVNFTGDISSVVAAIINVSILLLIAAIFFGRLLSNSVTSPLSKISRKMLYMDVSKKPEHIQYKRNDELGSLVKAYNTMVDSLAESTKQMALEERQKAWSDMARRIAHEIKNPLTPMKLSLQRLINLKKKNAPGWQEKLEDISKSVLEQIDILSNTASEFSSYAKFFVEDNSIIDLHSILKEQKVLFDNADNIRLAFSCDENECPVYARKGQIIRVIVNLISNAIQAVEGGSSMGYILISLSKREENYIVSVADNGGGVASQDIDKLFTPNFTTKSSGNGLGLAISKSIIEQSGGKIWYSRSELGGACFTFSLPKFVQ